MASLKKRGTTYYAQYYVGMQQKRVCLDTSSLQVAKEKVRQIESAMLRGNDLILPTKTPVAQVVTAYVDYLHSVKTERNVRRDVHYLREAFGPICPALQIKNAKLSVMMRRCNPRQGRPVIDGPIFEQITTADIAQFISIQTRRRSLAPKTANRYREILTRLYNWAMEQHGIRIPNDRNPAAKVERYREKAPTISFLTLEQIDEQLDALKEYPQLQTQVALFIFAGVRREEALWLTHKDIDLKAGRHGMIRVQAKTVNGEYWESIFNLSID
jgi:integrase